MAGMLRMCLFDAVNPPGGPFRDPFRQLADVQVVGEFSTWEKLQECLSFASVHFVAVNLDAAKPADLVVVQQINELAPDCAILGVSGTKDPQAIIAAMRAGCAQFVTWPIDQADLESAVDRIRSTRAPLDNASRRICVVGASGGAGATTIACNLAMELAHLTVRRCALVDLNLEFGDVSCAFDVEPKYSIADVCRDGIECDRTLLETVLHELPPHVSLLSRPERVEDARAITPEGVDAMLHMLGQMFPFVVVDLPRHTNYLSSVAVSSADRVLVVAQLSVPLLRNAKRVFRSLMELGATEDRIEIVLNRCNANFERITAEEVEKQFSRPLFAVVPNDYRRVGASRDMGKPIMNDAPNSPARLAIQTLARKLSGADETAAAPDAAAGAAGSRLLGKFWKKKPASTRPGP